MDLQLSQQSALKLTLNGSVGSFKVSGNTTEFESLEVKFFLTHVSLDFDNGSKSDVLEYLAPVREIYESETLEFDEIMQRDLDDARVSSDLIPYLLDPSSRDLVKIFPPIIVVILPTSPGSDRPAEHYPKIHRIGPTQASTGKHQVEILRSGEVGSEVFEFENPVQDGKSIEHDLARLKLNPQRTKLVIVDGQHRAMALLALYRNLRKEWSTSARRQPYKDYYAEWTEDYIKTFKLDKLSMPVMFCTFPDLDVNFSREYDLKKAARAIFLALNKNAKKVSDSRNRLLDDHDIVALFLRSVLSKIKNAQKSSFRICNVELDQTHDKMKIESPIALTGVNHVYYMIEHCLLSQGTDLSGVKQRRGNYANRVRLDNEGALERLDGRNKLGADVANSISRNKFSVAAGELLAAQFTNRHGKIIQQILKQFKPFEWHTTCTLNLQKELETNKPRVKTILFDGQGIYNVFHEHRKNLKEKFASGKFKDGDAEIESLVTRLDGEAESIKSAIGDLYKKRFDQFVHGISDRSKVLRDGRSDKLHQFLNQKLYMNVLTTVAFQTALVTTFISAFENSYGLNFWEFREDIDLELENYLKNIEVLFCPNSPARLKNLIEVFEGQVDESPDGLRDFKVIPSRSTFRSIVYSEEMKPEQFPKYRYLLIELWAPIDGDLQSYVLREKQKCRAQIMIAHVRKCRELFIKDNRILEENLTHAHHKEIQQNAAESYKALIKCLGDRSVSIEGLINLLESGDEDAHEMEIVDEDADM